jgi:hypothetical protein
VEHWCKTIFLWFKDQPKIRHFAKQIFKKSVSMSTFKPPKVGEKKIIVYSLLLLYLAGGNSLCLLYPAGGNSFVLLSLAGKQFDLTYFYREETNLYLFPPAG